MRDGVSSACRARADARSDHALYPAPDVEVADDLHPYRLCGLAEIIEDAIHRALEMPPEERRARMSRMRTYVREHNIYRWAGNLISELTSVRVEDALPPQPRLVVRGGEPVPSGAAIAAMR